MRPLSIDWTVVLVAEGMEVLYALSDPNDYYSRIQCTFGYAVQEFESTYPYTQEGSI